MKRMHSSRPDRSGARPRGRGASCLPAAAGTLAALLLVGCAGPDETAGTAGARLEPGSAERPSAGDVAVREAERLGDADGTPADYARGELLSFACRACHGLTPNEPSPLGPPLHGMFGRPAASVQGFDYSAALEQSGIVWTAETLDAWLARPDEYIPGNNMAFTGFRSADDRRALIAYLKVKTDE